MDSCKFYMPKPPSFTFTAKVLSFDYTNGKLILRPGDTLTEGEVTELESYYESPSIAGEA